MGTFTRSQSTADWTSFSTELAVHAHTAGDVPPQLCLCCQDLAMAEALAGRRPSVVEPYLAGPPEVIAFPDGQAAVRFVLRDGAKIVPFVGLLVQGDYGVSRLVIKAGIAPGLPAADRASLLKMLGISQAILLNETFAW